MSHDDNSSSTSASIPPDPTELLDKFRELVSSAYQQHDAAAVHIRAMALIGRLKSVHRASNTATRARREETAAARQEMDQSHLNLQNLLYEKRHLEREIEKCRQFASIYQDIPLHTLDGFLQLAPPEVRTSEVLADEHQLMLNRLNFELAERQRLDQKRKDLVQAKEELLKESKLKSTTLDSVKTQIELLVKAASDIQKKVDDIVQPISSHLTNDI